MKRIMLKSVVAIVFLSTLLVSCKKDEKKTSPVLPPQESMLMNFSNFSSAKKSISINDTVGYGNWGASALTVGFWSLAVYINSAIPVAAFKEAFNHQPVSLGDTTWRWAYSIDNYGFKLDAKMNSSSTNWTMYVTKTSGLGMNFTDFIWFTGTSSNNGTSATWRLNRGPEFNGRPYLDVTWTKNVSLRYTLVDTTEAGVGNYLEYDKINEAGLDAQFLIRTVDHLNDVDIQWNLANNNGRVKCQKWYNNLDWHCWDNNHKNTTCQ
jgi:hypothetical protein